MTTPPPKPAGNLPPEAAARLKELLWRLPRGWTVARTWQDDAGSWVAELQDGSGLTIGQVALSAPPSTGQAVTDP